MAEDSPRLGAYGPAAVVVATHEHFSAPTADGAVGLVAVIVVLVGALQEGVLEKRWKQEFRKAEQALPFL